MKKKIGVILTVCVLLIGLLAAGGYAAYQYLFQDLTGMTYEEIQNFKAANPRVRVTYSVTIPGGSQPLVLTQDSTQVRLESFAQAESLVQQAEYLQGLSVIDFAQLAPTGQQVQAMETAFPNAAVSYSNVTILGKAYPLDTQQVDLSAMTAQEMDAVIEALKPLTNLSSINLLDGQGNSQLSLDDMVTLYTAYPQVQFTYATELFGQRVSTDMESLEYFKVNIGDKGLEEFRKILPIMPNLSYLKLDWCETSDEAMAQLRADFPDIEIHWRIFYSVFNCMTDNYRLWTIGGLMDKQIGPFQHLRGVKYLDLGHNFFTHLDFMENLKDLEVAILAIGQLEDISGIENCTKLEFLEIFSNRKLDNEDMQHLSGLVNLEYLNISNIPNMTDLSFTDNMTKLKKLWCTLSNVPQAEIDRVKALHPDCEFVFLPDGDPTNYGWRNNPDGSYTARYALLREQIGYDRDQVAQYPKGELKEEITYQSTGITPDD